MDNKEYHTLRPHEKFLEDCREIAYNDYQKGLNCDSSRHNAKKNSYFDKVYTKEYIKVARSSAIYETLKDCR